MNRSNKSQSSQKKENSQMFSNMSIRNNTINSSQNQSSNNSVGFLQNTKNQIFKGISNALPKKSTAQQIFRAPVPTWGGFVDPHQISMDQYNYADDDPVVEVPKSNSENLSQPVKVDFTDLEKTTSLSIRLKQSTIISSSFNDQTLPMLVSLSAESQDSTEKAPIDLICVIDRSGSMMGDKMELAKNALCSLLDFLEDSDRISILVFDHAVERICPLLRATQENKHKIISMVKKIRATGANDINLGLTHAFRTLEQRRTKNPVQSIFLLSDGIEPQAQDRVKVTLERFNIPSSITINTFGFGSDHDPQLLTDISNFRDGNFYFIQKLDTIDEAFVDCLGGLVSSVAQNIQIKIMPEQSHFLQGVQITKAYGDSSMWTQDGDSFTTTLACLISGIKKDYVLELKIPINKQELTDDNKHVRVAKAEVSMVGLDGHKIVKQVELNITLLNEGEVQAEDETGEADREVMKNFYRVKGALVIEDARKLADQGQYDKAKQLLVFFREEVENSFLKDEEFIKNLVKDVAKAAQDVSSVVYQQYGRQNMFENARGQMQQRSNLSNANCNQNSLQMAWTNAVKSSKHH